MATIRQVLWQRSGKCYGNDQASIMAMIRHVVWQVLYISKKMFSSALTLYRLFADLLDFFS